MHFVNENLGGHATLHRHLRGALDAHLDLEPSFFDAPPPTLLHRLARVEIPGLARLDLDLAPLRDQVVRSAVVERHLRGLDREVDVLHVYTHNAGLLSVGRMKRLPTVVSLDATNRQNAYRHPHRVPTRFTAGSVRPAAALERRVYESARALITHSSWAADSVASYGIDRQRIEVIPFGIPLGDEPVPCRDGGLPRILFVGATMERKGGWRLLDLWRRHLSDRSRLVLVTRDHVPAEPGLEVHGDIHPGDGRIEAVLAEADVYAMPSEIDAFGYSLLEAMAAALPVVAVGQAAVPEIVVHGTTGVLVSPGDDEGLREALSDLLPDSAARAEMGAAGRERVREHFCVTRTTAALADVLRSVS